MSIEITVDTYEQLGPVLQRVLCWAAADKAKVRLDTQGNLPKVVIPDAVPSGKGSLLLRRGGADLASGHTVGVVTTVNSAGVQASAQDVNTCPASTNQPVVSAVAYNVGGNPRTITLTYATVASNGTVDIEWGDGTTTAGAAESGTSNHTYPQPGSYRVRVLDASAPANFTENWIKVG
jgi:hypothetical protein